MIGCPDGSNSVALKYGTVIAINKFGMIARHAKGYSARNILDKILTAFEVPPSNGELKMTRPPELIRDFIQDCLYNPDYGYFQRNVNIFQSTPAASGSAVDVGARPDEFINFAQLKNQDEYNETLYRMYQGQTKSMKFYQLWHTPSELFRPWYAMAIANYALGVLSNGSHDYRREEPLVIYEVGPGNGTLCRDFLQFLQLEHPGVFARTEYHLIEISKHLVEQKLNSLKQKYPKQVYIHNQSFFGWRQVEPRPCLVIAMEMFDNLPQDRVRFKENGMLEQGMVVTNDNSRYYEEQRRLTETWTEATDPLILETVEAMDEVGHKWSCLKGSIRDAILNTWPFSAFSFESHWRHEFIPTGPYYFMKILRDCFPKHTFLMTDFDQLPEAIPGHGSPVVQTRYEGDTVACSTYLLQRGLFDIFFPVNFHLISKLYSRTMKNTVSNAQRVSVMKHKEFCQKYAQIENTKTRSGYNPMLDDFKNVSFLSSNLTIMP